MVMPWFLGLLLVMMMVLLTEAVATALAMLWHGAALLKRCSLPADATTISATSIGYGVVTESHTSSTSSPASSSSASVAATRRSRTRKLGLPALLLFHLILYIKG